MRLHPRQTEADDPTLEAAVRNLMRSTVCFSRSASTHSDVIFEIGAAQLSKLCKAKLSYATKMFSCCSARQPASRRATASQLVIPSGRVVDQWGKGVSLMQQQEGSPELASAVSQQPQFAPPGTHSLPYATAKRQAGSAVAAANAKEICFGSATSGAGPTCTLRADPESY
jgi:hypothetical protein